MSGFGNRFRRALPAPEYPVCPSCGVRHAPLPHLAAGGGLAAYGRTLLSDPGRPAPLGRGPADQRPILRDQVSAWRHGTPDPPPPDPKLAAFRAELRAGPAPATPDPDLAPGRDRSGEAGGLAWAAPGRRRPTTREAPTLGLARER